MTTAAPKEWVVDAVLAAAFAAFTVASVLTDDPAVAYDFEPPTALTVLLALLASLPLALRRRWPLAVTVVASTALTVLAAAGWNASSAAACTMFAVYAVAAWATLARAIAGLLVVYAGMGVLTVLGAHYFDHPLAVVSIAAVTIAWTVGLVMRQWREARTAAEAAAVEAEGQRAVAAERAVFDERLRIARELHDVVIHALSDVAVQAGVARFAGPSGDPAAISRALAAIEQASRTALDDLRRMLGLLRAPVPSGASPLVTTDPEGQQQPPAGEAVSGRRHVRESIVDIAIALALAAYGVASAFVVDPSIVQVYPAPAPGLVILILIATLSLAVRRRWPVVVMLVAFGSTTAVDWLGANSDVTGIASLVALYTVAAWRPIRITLAAAAIPMTYELVNAVREGLAAYLVKGDLVAVAVAFGLGLIVRRWREARADALVRAVVAERMRAVLAERAVVAERLRIARDLHDVVAHTLSLVAVQAGVARYSDAAVTDPQSAQVALAAAEQASRTALHDLRRMLLVLHSGEDEGPASLQPSPNLSDLDRLVVVDAGTVTFDVGPAALQAPPSMQLTAYRLVQEALTNVRKHAPGSNVWVRVGVVDGELTVRVDDDGLMSPAAPSPGTGFGLVGMRERVALFDGTVDAAPRSDGGFRVEARLRGARAAA